MFPSLFTGGSLWSVTVGTWHVSPCPQCRAGGPMKGSVWFVQQGSVISMQEPSCASSPFSSCCQGRICSTKAHPKKPKYTLSADFTQTDVTSFFLWSVSTKGKRSRFRCWFLFAVSAEPHRVCIQRVFTLPACSAVVWQIDARTRCCKDLHVQHSSLGICNQI